MHQNVVPSQSREFVAFHPSPSVTKHTQPIRILVVDNDSREAEEVKRQIMAARPEIDDSIKLAGLGLEAIVVAEAFQPDLILVRLGLPRRSAACTARLVRARPWAARVLIISHSIGDSNESDHAAEFDFQFYDGLDMPLLMQMFENLLLRRSRLRSVPGTHKLRMRTRDVTK